MRTRTMRAASAVGAALLLAALVGSATAGKFSVSNRSIRATWTALEFSGGFVTIRCPTTLEGSFHSATIRKTVGALIGYISRGTVQRPCVNGLTWLFSEEPNEVLGGTFRGSMPWHITYRGFSGVLPMPLGLNLEIVGMKFMVRALVSGITILCEYLTGPANGGSLTGTLGIGVSGAVSGLTFDETRRITSETGGLCPEVGLGGTGNVRLLGASTAITVRLI